MQKKILAAVVASMVAGQAMAVTIVDDGTNKATIGGYLDLRYIDQDNSVKGHAGDSSRINFAFEHKLTEATTVFSKAEWGFDTTNDDTHVEVGEDKDFMWQRLAYIGAKNDQLGAISYGQQWSTYGLVAGWTDVFATTGGEASGYYGAEGDALGTARAEDALQYNHSFMGLNVSAQYQVGEKSLNATETRDGSYGVAASYDLPMGLSIGAAYNEAKVDSTVAGDDFKAKSAIVGAKFEADKIYAAVTFAKLKNRDVDSYVGDAEKSEGLEMYASYQLNEMFKVGGGYNQLKDKSNAAQKGEMKYIPVEVVYTQGPIQLSGTYQFEDSKKADGTKAEDKVVLQARYYF
ncbi:porin [Endozoicomonas elysicola]|uniref:porin n=1 Tax=Endozoicomonas elysicola TaxID=305900 RepID=UPI00037CA0D5|nr:porin [Endozoicomonas elysicola]